MGSGRKTPGEPVEARFRFAGWEPAIYEGGRPDVTLREASVALADAIVRAVLCTAPGVRDELAQAIVNCAAALPAGERQRLADELLELALVLG